MRVLLVEDEALLARTVVAGLEAEGIRTDHQANGVDGLWAATENSYDVVVLDIMLPGLNGYDVLKHLRAHEVWTPVLMLTAKDGEYDQTDAFELGADDYLTKPFTFSLLVARLHALARRGPGTRPVVLRVGSLALDPVRRTVRRGELGDAGDELFGIGGRGGGRCDGERHGLQPTSSSALDVKCSSTRLLIESGT